MNSTFFKNYSKIIQWCERNRNSHNLFRKNTVKLIGGILFLLVSLMSILKGIHFPERKLGSRFWIYQWRFEFLMGWIEPETIPWVKKYVKPGMVVVDIGAHVGYYTNIFSQQVGTNGKVLAFEASPENYPVLLKNIKAFGKNNILPYQMAVSDQNTTLNLFISPGHSNHSIIEERTEEADTVAVQSIRLDDFPHLQKVDFVKMDVEGAEPRVLNGMRQLINNSDNLIMVVEYNHVVLSKAYSDPKILLDLLTELGLQFKAILDNGELGEIPVGTKTLNLLCWKPSITIQ